jgi:hypothetical protein
MGKMKEIATTATQAMTTSESNPWLDYGNSATGTRIVGKLLKFSKFGQWTAGQDNDEIAMGTEMVAHVIEIYVGWIRWEDNRPVEQLMRKLGEGVKTPFRSELSHTDRNLWPIDDRGVPRDPWQFSNYLILMDGEGQLYTFATASKGGMGAIGALAKAYGLRMRLHGDEVPVVKLGWDSYDHPNKAYGEIRFPTLEIVRWVDRSAIDEVLLVSSSGGNGDDEPDDDNDEPETAPAKPAKPAKPAPAPAALPNRKARF